MAKTSKKTQFQPGQSGNPNGRPKRYTKAYVEGELCNELNKWVKEQIDADEVLWVKGFLLRANTDYAKMKRIVDNPNEYPLFSKTYAQALSIQEEQIAKKALSNKYNSQFAQFCLKNNHGWKDRSEIEQTTIEGYKPPAEGAINASEEKREKYLKLRKG